MTKPTIVTRAGKGSALSWTEGDANLTNLQNATIAIKADTGGTDVVSDLNGTVTLVAGTNVTITGDNTAKTVTINASGGSSGISDVVADTSPQLGGDLDVNGKNITSASNGNINIIPNGSGNIYITPATGKIVLGAADWPAGSGSAGQVLTTSGGTGVLTWETPTGGSSDLVSDTSPQLGGDLDVNGKNITSASNGNINITPNGSGNIYLSPATGKVTISATNFPTGAGTNGQFLQTDGTGNASWATVSAGASTLDGLSDVVITAAATNDVLVYNGTNWVDTDLSSITVGTATVGSTVTIANATGATGARYLTFVDSNTGANALKVASSITYNASTTGLFIGTSGAGGNIWVDTITTGTANGAIDNMSIGATTAKSGKFTTLTADTTTLDDIRETVYAIGNSGTSTLTPNAANGSIQTITATGNFTLSAFSSPVSGQTITFIITQDGTGSRTLTSTMKFAGGSKTLSTAASSIDILTVSYIGTTYYASLSKGFA